MPFFNLAFLITFNAMHRNILNLVFCVFSGLLQKLLSQKWTEPSLNVLLAHYLDSLGHYLKIYPDSIAPVVNKLFELLTSLPLTVKVFA